MIRNCSLLLFLLFSSFANAINMRVETANHSCIFEGEIIDMVYHPYGQHSLAGKCAGITVTDGSSSVGIKMYGSKIMAISSLSGNGSYLHIGYASKFDGCPDGQGYNPSTGQCEDTTPFCSRPDTVKQMSDFSQSCSAQGEGYMANIVCRDDDEYLSMSCDAPPPPPDECTPDSPDWPNCKPPTECTPDMPEYPSCCDETNNYCDNPPPEECTIFSPNWPECSGDTDIDPDTGGGLGDPDKPPGGGSGDPDPDKPEPDVEDNSEALGAISDLNKDMNKQLTAINNDLNKNHAESKSALDALKASIDLNTDTIVDGANHLQDSIEGQTKTLSDIGNKTNGLLTSANHLLKNGFSDLSDDLSNLKNSNEKGFGDVVNALDELGNKQVDGNQHGTPEGLYTSAEYNAMLGDVAQLKEEYKSVLNDFKRYFNFNSGVNSGDFNAHNLPLNWRGNPINQQNQVMTTLRDNSGIVGAVVLFVFGMLGIRALTGAL